MTKIAPAAAFLGVWLLLAASAARSQNVISNGGFEFPALTHSGFFPSLLPGSTNLPGWSIGGTGGFYLILAPTNRLQALDGKQYLDFNGKPNGVTLSQSFPTIVGETYEVAFTLGRFQAPDTERVTAEVRENGGGVLHSVDVLAPLNVGWGATSRFRFRAISSISTLEFRSTNGGPNVELCMDAVSVERITPRLWIETSQVRICWDGETNRSYQLQYRSALTTNEWTDLDSPISGSGSNCIVQPVTNPQRFYRILRLP